MIRCMMKYLPNDLKLKIISYLPIVDFDHIEFMSSIRKMYYLFKLRRIYKSTFVNFNNSYEDWLLNDITKWMNNGISLSIHISQRYLNFMYKALQISDCENIFDILSCESYYTPRKLCEYYFLSLSFTEIHDLISHFKNVYSIEMI